VGVATGKTRESKRRYKKVAEVERREGADRARGQAGRPAVVPAEETRNRRSPQPVLQANIYNIRGSRKPVESLQRILARRGGRGRHQKAGG
jgi:hypothetical protein